eukprot:CAMPEP_0202916586 /NCGR_PEP_ID=MMETSP1392-20130828/68950_1 /ASSEMBLY_ACC=CAM_ASM_000868 /TAXON_ID=225041 /ORGANISM="Chlamydomonas chlamydogama, Strain SAG 11-48b" /LENGTH=67 /DNA_ID=CAMNT_0049609079 /DNA_START=407 /DNA_END=607 /DNA_ORIENTATION=+
MTLTTIPTCSQWSSRPEGPAAPPDLSPAAASASILALLAFASNSLCISSSTLLRGLGGSPAAARPLG